MTLDQINSQLQDIHYDVVSMQDAIHTIQKEFKKLLKQRSKYVIDKYDGKKIYNQFKSTKTELIFTRYLIERYLNNYTIRK